MADKKTVKKNEGFWARVWLLIRALFNIIAFVFFFYAISVSHMPLMIIVASILIALAAVLNVLLPLVRLK